MLYLLLNNCSINVLIVLPAVGSRDQRWGTKSDCLLEIPNLLVECASLSLCEMSEVLALTGMALT